MAKFAVPRTEFVPHPMGQSEGVIYEVRDLGEIETPFGIKHKVAIKVQSFTQYIPDEDGKPSDKPFSVQKMMNLSGHEASDLYKFRCAALQVANLTEDQAYNFDDSELLGVRLGYNVAHTVSQKNGNTYANIDSVWRLEDQTKGEIILEPQDAQTEGGPSPATAGAPVGAASATQDENLPF